MSDYINKIKKDETEYDIQDARVPEINAGAEGKVLKVDSGAVIFDETFFTKVLSNTINNVTSLISYDQNAILCGEIMDSTHNIYTSKGIITNINTRGQHQTLYGFDIFDLTRYRLDRYTSADGITFTDSIQFLTPSTNYLDSTKTYQLQTAGQGTPEWAEASAGGGTQLYKHETTLNWVGSGSNSGTVHITTISTYSESYAVSMLFDFLSGKSSNVNYVNYYNFYIYYEESSITVSGVNYYIQTNPNAGAYAYRFKHAHFVRTNASQINLFNENTVDISTGAFNSSSIVEQIENLTIESDTVTAL